MNVNPLVYDEKMKKYTIENYRGYFALKENYILQWEGLLNILRLNKNFARIKDMTFSTVQYSFKASIPFLYFKGGLILCVSILTKSVGIYYDNGEIISTGFCIYDYRGNVENPYISYYPNNKMQEDLGRMIIDNALEYFNGFQKFDNFYASEEFDNLDIDVFECDKLNFFQVVFCSNVYGII